MIFRKTSFLFLLALSCFALAACDSPAQKEAKYLERGNALFAQGDYAKARLEYKNAARIAPTDPEVRYRLALTDEAEGHIGDAIRGFMAAEQQNAHFDPAVLKLAAYFLAAEQYEEVRKRIDLLLEDNPNDAQAHALRGALLLRLKNPFIAEKEARIALEKDPANVLGFSVLAGIYVAENDLPKALAAVEDGIGRNPKDLSLLLLKANLYGKQNDVPKIAETYEAIFKLRPNEPRFRFELAAIYVKAGKSDEAEATLRAAVASFPDDWEVKRNLVAFLSDHRDMAAAEKEILAYRKAAPDRSELTFWLADLYMKHDATEKAVALLEEAVREDTDAETGLNARTSLARIRFLQGDRNMAEKLADIVLAKDSNNADALFMRARLAFDRGDYQRAVSDLRTILRDRPATPKALQLLAETFLYQGHLDLAIDTLNQLVAVDPADPKARIRLAQLYGMQGDTHRALDMMAIVTKADPAYSVGWESTARIAIDAKEWQLAEDAIGKLDALEGHHMTALFLKAQLLAANGKKEDALPLYKKVIDADPSSPLSEHALPALIDASRDLGRLPETASYIAGLKTESGVAASLLGEIYLAMGKPDDAARAFDQAIERGAGLQDPFLNRAKLYLKDGKSEDAVRTLEKAETLVPADSRAPLMRAEIFEAQGKIDESIAIYDDLLMRDPTLDVAANNMAQTIADDKSGDADALEKARLAAERFIGSSDPYFLDTLGWVYLRQGKVAQAQPVLERAMTLLAAAPPQMQYHYGSLLLKTGRKQEAKEALSKATVEGAHYPGLDEAKTLLKGIE